MWVLAFHTVWLMKYAEAMRLPWQHLNGISKVFLPNHEEFKAQGLSPKRRVSLEDDNK